MTDTRKIAVENVNVPGRTSHVNAQKYTAMRTAMLKVMPAAAPGSTQSEIAEAVLPHLPQDLWPNGRKRMWWIKTVQLDLESKGLLIRNTSAKPLRWYRA